MTAWLPLSIWAAGAVIAMACIVGLRAVAESNRAIASTIAGLAEAVRNSTRKS